MHLKLLSMEWIHILLMLLCQDVCSQFQELYSIASLDVYGFISSERFFFLKNCKLDVEI